MFRTTRSEWLPSVRTWQVFILLLLVSMVSLFSVKLLMTKHVYIVDKTRDIEIKTMTLKVKSLLKKLDIQLEEADRIEPDLKTSLKDGMVITITRAYPINVEMDGEIQQVMTTKNQVGAILAEMGVGLGPLDVVVPAAEKSVYENELIRITRIEEQIDERSEKVAFKTLVKLDSKLKPGQEVIESEGVKGEKVVKRRIVLEDGKEVECAIEEETVHSEPVDRVVRRAPEMLFITDQGKPYECSAIVTMKASAYDLSFESCGKYPDHPQYGITRSGTHARPGVVAVDPRVVSLGSKLYVESLDRTQDYGFASAEDTGGAIKGHRIDLFIGNNREAYRYGMRYVKVYVLEDSIDESLIVGYGY